jgi:hypothetical protein
VFHAAGQVAVRNGLLIAGVMCVAGIIGPAVNHIALRQIGIIGYAIVWPIVCVPLSKAFRQAGLPSGAIVRHWPRGRGTGRNGWHFGRSR